MEMKSNTLWRSAGRLVADIVLFYVIGTLITMFLCVPLFLIQKALGMEMQEGSLPSFFLERLLMLIGYLSAAVLVLRWRNLPLSLLGMSLRGRGKDLLAGLGVAVLLYAVGFGTSLLMGTVEIASVEWVPRDLLGTLLFFLLVAVTEEVMLRGFVLGRMLSAGMNRFVALFLSSALFSAFSQLCICSIPILHSCRLSTSCWQAVCWEHPSCIHVTCVFLSCCTGSGTGCKAPCWVMRSAEWTAVKLC